MRVRFISFLLCATLVGCASSPPRWYLNGRSNEEFQQIHAQCDAAAANQIGQGSTGPLANNYAIAGAMMSLMGGVFAASSTYDNCMKAQGFTPAK